MTTLSVRLSDELLKEAEHSAKAMHVPRAEYIRRAIEAMNKEVLTRRRRERLMKVSARVKKESMRVNAEFSVIEHDPEI
ncbi:MAG TPA: ribbon-helix-helix protein, CopG family [Burkholderiales bacterium]